MREFCPTDIDTFHNHTDSALHLLNILDILTVTVCQNNYLKVLHPQHKGLSGSFQIHFQYAGNIHGYNTRYAYQQNLCKPLVCNN